MAWEWSHTHEAYDNARENLSQLDLADLKIIFAEWRAAQVKGGEIEHNSFCQRKYDRALKYAITLSRDQLVEFIWDRASDLATCDNGGFNAYMCPDGCHTVSFDSVGREIDPDKSYWYCSSMYMIEFELPGQCILDCYHQGDCENEVDYWIPKLELDIDRDHLIGELIEYGAWDLDELQDHDQNIARIVWLAAGDLQETINAGEYTC